MISPAALQYQACRFLCEVKSVERALLPACLQRPKSAGKSARATRGFRSNTKQGRTSVSHDSILGYNTIQYWISHNERPVCLTRHRPRPAEVARPHRLRHARAPEPAGHRRFFCHRRQMATANEDAMALLGGASHGRYYELKKNRKGLALPRRTHTHLAAHRHF